MSDTPTQAAARLLDRASAVPSYGWTAFAGHVQIPRTEDHPGYDINLLPGHHRPTSVALARFIAACDPQTITMICQALAAQAQELDALRADAERYRHIRDDGEWAAFDTVWLHEHNLYGQGAADMDAAIDAARKEG